MPVWCTPVTQNRETQNRKVKIAKEFLTFR